MLVRLVMSVDSLGVTHPLMDLVVHPIMPPSVVMPPWLGAMRISLLLAARALLPMRCALAMPTMLAAFLILRLNYDE